MLLPQDQGERAGLRGDGHKRAPREKPGRRPPGRVACVFWLSRSPRLPRSHTPLLSFQNQHTHKQAWAYEQVRVPGTRGVLNWSSGLLQEGEWLYLVGVHGEGIAAKQVLARVPCEAGAMRLDFAEMEGACVCVRTYAPSLSVQGPPLHRSLYARALSTVWARDPKAAGARWIPNEAFMAVEPYYTLGECRLMTNGMDGSMDKCFPHTRRPRVPHHTTRHDHCRADPALGPAGRVGAVADVRRGPGPLPHGHPPCLLQQGPSVRPSVSFSSLAPSVFALVCVLLSPRRNSTCNRYSCGRRRR